MKPFEDSTRKHKLVDARPRSAVLSAVFILGMCLGGLVAEKLCINIQDAQTPETALQILCSKSCKHESSTAAATAVATATLPQQGTSLFLKGGKPRNYLETILQSVAPDGEVMVVISNINLIRDDSLVLWLHCVDRIESKNWLVVAIDEELRDYCIENGINHYYRPVAIPDSQKDIGSNHAVSSMKYEILEEFLILGWNVLLSDVDIVTLQDPFNFLYRDSDVEGMSDGFEPGSAYGAIYQLDDPAMGWSRYSQGFKHSVLNSGLFYVRASSRTIELMQRIAGRLRKEAAWDQSVYNEEIFTLSHGTFKNTQVSVRVMEMEKFMNSKVLFKQARHQPGVADEKNFPVMVHMNYHPDKTERMRGAISFYLEGKKDALKDFPGGSEIGT